MKNLITIFTCLILLSSCQDDKIRELNIQISQLEDLNKKLTDSINKTDFEKITNSELIILTNDHLIIGEENEVLGMLVEHQSIPEFNLYSLDTIAHANNVKREHLLKENFSKTFFNFSFKPKSAKDSVIYVLAEFKLDTIAIQVPGVVNVKLREKAGNNI